METYALSLTAELARAGHDVTLFVQDYAEVPPDLGVRVVRGLALRRRLDLPLFDGHKPDVWHVLNAGYAWLASYKAPVFASVYGNDFLSPWVMAECPDFRTRLRLPAGTRFDTWLGRRLSARAMGRGFAKVRHTFACSGYTESVFLRQYPQCRDRTSVAYVGVSCPADPPARSPYQPGRVCELVTVCRLSEPRKNVDVVLRALAELPPDIRFRYTVVGDGPLRPQLERLAGSLGLVGRVRFVGRVSDSDLHLHLAAADLFVLTSGVSSTTVEGFGIVYLEANAHGLPVLAARCGGAAEAVEEGVSGWFVDDTTPTAVAAELARFLRGEVRFSADACWEFAGRFTWVGLAARMCERYAAVKSERPVSPGAVELPADQAEG